MFSLKTKYQSLGSNNTLCHSGHDLVPNLEKDGEVLELPPQYLVLTIYRYFQSISHLEVQVVINHVTQLHLGGDNDDDAGMYETNS